MHFSPIAIGVTTLFILSRLVAASSDHVDVAASLPNPAGQLKPAHERFTPHHHRKGGDNGFPTITIPTTLRQRQLISPSTQRAVNKMLMGTLFRRASTKTHSATGNMAQLAKQSMSISNKISSAANEYTAVRNGLAGIPGAARSSFVQTSAKIQSQFSLLRNLYRQQTIAIQGAQSSYRGTETNAKKLWGRSPNELSRNTLSRRAPKNTLRAPAGKGVKTSPGDLAQLKKQSLAIGAKVDEAWKEQQALRQALSGAGFEGVARTAIDQLEKKIESAFQQLHHLFHQL